MKTVSYVAAVLELFRGHATMVFPEVAAVIAELLLDVPANRIQPSLDGITLPANAIIVEDAGGFGPVGDLPHSQQRVSIKCYGKNPLLAERIAALARLILMPVQRHLMGFTAASTRVLSVESVVGGQAQIDPPTGTPYRLLTASLRLSDVAVAA